MIDCVLQLPFLPHWRVPEFLRGCLAVCCLEQSFLIRFHAPITPREVLLAGTCLVGSTEVIRKLPMHEQLPDGYGCVAIQDVNDVETLSTRLAAITADPELAAIVGARGRAFAQARQRDALYPSTLECVLDAASAGRPIPPEACWRSVETVGRSVAGLPDLSPAIEARQAETVCQSSTAPRTQSGDESAEAARCEVDQGLSERASSSEGQIELAVAAAEGAMAEHYCLEDSDPLFRLRIKQWAMTTKEIERLIPVRDSRLRIVDLDEHYFPRFASTQMGADPLSEAENPPQHLVAFVPSTGRGKSPQRIDGATAQILKLSDGRRTALEIARAMTAASSHPTIASTLDWIEYLFVVGFIGLREPAADRPVAA